MRERTLWKKLQATEEYHSISTPAIKCITNAYSIFQSKRHLLLPAVHYNRSIPCIPIPCHCGSPRVFIFPLKSADRCQPKKALADTKKGSCPPTPSRNRVPYAATTGADRSHGVTSGSRHAARSGAPCRPPEKRGAQDRNAPGARSASVPSASGQTAGTHPPLRRAWEGSPPSLP